MGCKSGDDPGEHVDQCIESVGDGSGVTEMQGWQTRHNSGIAQMVPCRIGSGT